MPDREDEDHRQNDKENGVEYGEDFFAGRTSVSHRVLPPFYHRLVSPTFWLILLAIKITMKLISELKSPTAVA